MIRFTREPALVAEVWSGGQTGADRGALEMAAELGIPTGGWAPRGWRTDAGPAPELGSRFGLREHASDGYPGRTWANVEGSHGTLIFGNPDSPGCRLTLKALRAHGRPSLSIRWSPDVSDEDLMDDSTVQSIRRWILLNEVLRLNVAGNRESSSPGIGAAVGRLLSVALRSRFSPGE